MKNNSSCPAPAVNAPACSGLQGGVIARPWILHPKLIDLKNIPAAGE